MNRGKIDVDTAAITTVGNKQVITLPAGISLPGESASVRVESNSLILEPTKPTSWPEGFFEAIRIEDAAFCRPDQGDVPPISLSGKEQA